MDGHSTQGHGRRTGVKCQYRTSQLHALGQSLNFLGPVISHLGQGSNPSPRRVKIKRDDMCNAKARPRLGPSSRGLAPSGRPFPCCPGRDGQRPG